MKRPGRFNKPTRATMDSKLEKAKHVCATCGYTPHGDDADHWKVNMDKHKQRCVELHGRPTARL